MTHANDNSFNYNKKHGHIYREDGDYHPVTTWVQCAQCGYEDDIDNMDTEGDLNFCKGNDCKSEFYDNGEIE